MESLLDTESVCVKERVPVGPAEGVRAQEERSVCGDGEQRRPAGVSGGQ